MMPYDAGWQTFVPSTNELKPITQLTREEAIEVIAYRDAYTRGRSDGQSEIHELIKSFLEAFGVAARK